MVITLSPFKPLAEVPARVPSMNEVELFNKLVS